MGQYYVIANMTKREFIHPHKLGCGLKAWEILANEMGTKAMFMLMVCPTPRGGGDLQSDNAVAVGRWHGDHVVVVGDYAQDQDFRPGFGNPEASEIYAECMSDEGSFTDVSDVVCRALERELRGRFEGEGWRRWTYSQEMMA